MTPEEKIEELVIRYLESGGTITDVHYNGRNLEYELRGFTKSGTGTLTANENGQIILETRYNTIDEIDDYDDIVYAAHKWYDWYKDWGCAEYWKKDFDRLGLDYE